MAGAGAGPGLGLGLESRLWVAMGYAYSINRGRGRGLGKRGMKWAFARLTLCLVRAPGRGQRSIPVTCCVSESYEQCVPV